MPATERPDDSACLDGNAAAGPLGELFALDLAAAILTCAHCGASGPLAAHHVYPHAPALVVRCPGCAGVVLRYASDARGLRLEMTGTRLLTVAPPDQASFA
ncbi:hypothetical protein FHX82_005310 [Amycolatopsis bartoniae]|uniref:Hydrogenase maturation nickel metallochaperone HypA n=1 Tax=Amycolatopsis bartoniae TaxID=941986 RepID=A0A8H9IP52_9PSEU|nr:DUF6510 family protein [Amycolatopsis bartoniae]MBB2938234.1 hypothetical protein [Amycolatopsis bartoniae]TVT09014.1 hypothetical protein FNH07_10250 [Amycolatopsis bartoniae]GHF33669.1 hypothetical protein GCM10017566_02880 [Amycolatopsis bartoniae]